MALTDPQKQRIGGYLQEQYGIQFTSSSGAFAFIDFLVKSKAAQIAEMIAWLDAQKVKNTAQLNTLDAQKASAFTALTSDNTALDVLKTSF